MRALTLFWIVMGLLAGTIYLGAKRAMQRAHSALTKPCI